MRVSKLTALNLGAIALATLSACGAKDEKPEVWTCQGASVPMGAAIECVSTTSDAMTSEVTISDGTLSATPTDGTTSAGSASDSDLSVYTCLPGQEGCPSTTDIPFLPPNGFVPPALGGGGSSDAAGSTDTATGGTGGSANGGASSSGAGGKGAAGGGAGGAGGAGAGGAGAASDGVGTPECIYVPDLTYCPPSGGAGNGSSATPGNGNGNGGSNGNGGANGNGGTNGNGGANGSGGAGAGPDGNGAGNGHGAQNPGGGNGGAGGSANGGGELECTKDKAGNRSCHSKTPSCCAGSHPSSCGACVPDSDTSGQCVPPADGGCWFTGGGFIVDADGKDNFGGNGKPMKDGRIQGEWNHVDHGTGHHAHGTVDYIVCKRVPGPGPGHPNGPQHAFDLNEVFFGGPARFNSGGGWADGYWYDVVATDHGEPGRNDTYKFSLRQAADPVKMQSGTLVYETSGNLSGGNIQLHPPNNGHPYTPSSLPSWVVP